MPAAKAQQLAFNHLTVENGLLSNSVLSIAQDQQGFLWFGTSIGLTRYDGARFKIYKSIGKDTQSLSSNNITTLYRDAQNNLWIGTSGGLDRYDPKTDAFERIWINGKRMGNIYSIIQDKQQRLWIGSTQGLHLLTDPGKRNFQSFYPSADSNNSIAGNIIRALHEDHQGRLWVGTNNGLTRLQWINGKISCTNFHHQPGNAQSLSADYITTIAEDEARNLWIGTQHDGINQYLPATNTFKTWSHANNQPGIINNNIRIILATSRGQLWVGTQEGLSIIDPHTGAISSYQQEAGNKKSLSQNSIYSILEDANGSIWVGTYFGGANSTYSYSTPFQTIQNNQHSGSLSNNVVSSMVEDQLHNLWIGTEGGGLNYYDRNTGTFTAYKNNSREAGSLGSNLVKVVYLDKDGNPWCGTHGGGLNVYDRQQHKFIRYLYKESDPNSLTTEITSITEDALGRLWIVSQAGISIYQRNGTQLVGDNLRSTVSPLPGQAANVYTDKAGNVWIAGVPGLYKITGQQSAKIDSVHYINCIREDREGRIWLGLSYNGLAQYDPHRGVYAQYGKKLLPANTNVVGILDDEQGNLWLSSNMGLIKYNPSQNTAQTYTMSDGLAGNEFNFNAYLRDSRGNMYFGGFNGITHFTPARVETNQYTAPVIFTGLRLFNNPVAINDDSRILSENIALSPTLTFRYNQDVFTIEYALLNYIKSSKNKYAYQLEGFDKGWNEVTTNAATYTNLPAGTYTFRVKGANNDGIWSQPASITIKVLPPFWLTWWAFCIYILALAALLFLVVRYLFLRALLKKEDELHQVKLNFFTNVSHEIRTHLTLIMAPIEKMIDYKHNDPFVQQQLSQVKNNSNRLLKLVSELMDFRKAETSHLQLHIARHNLVPFLQEIYVSFREMSLAKEINMSFIHNTEDMHLYFDREQLEKVFFNLLANAFKFTPAGGRIILLAEQKDNIVTVTVTDNGRGIAPEYIDKLFTNFFQVADHGQQNTGYGIGLALSRNIVELHKGTIKVESDPATQGREGKTVFTVTLRQGNLHLQATDTTQPVTTEPGYEVQIISTQKPALPAQEPAPLKPFTLLIAEDNEQLRQLIKDTFIAEYNILEYPDGAAAWHAATEQIPDLIISDVMMPEMDGFTLCEKLKTDERTSHIPVILLTAKSTQSDQVSGLETGADLYLTKPFSTKVLQLNVRNLLAAREKMRQKFSSQLSTPPASDGIATVAAVKDVLPNTIDQEFLQKIIGLVEEHMDDPEFGVEMLTRKVAMSAPVLYKKIKAVTDMSVNEFVKSIRLRKAAELLAQKQLTVYEVAFAVGYNDRKYFSREFKKQYGKTPSEYADVEPE
ncbi:hybrid sensor histidine kinase/response regulator transcription factor [Paraflavitalea sp. CAU 1676]|uniref:hybrid sensor histidine kinase/response regulator transcription factor n=1 Tax=Paraflavitalea sp. CAU 1676 TaxID=3032598 RepID=UPI0023DCA18F|nr:hybrid sensor histidine kinase/response regulator transcription factor [Paraflavitalea sp. CAU 1676]MDF2190367.1 two-component regulator propeller domain-containing protein [Paraflavitalea sp. CAU 1676]